MILEAGMETGPAWKLREQESGQRLRGTLDLEVVGVCVSMGEKWTVEVEVSDFLLSSFPPIFLKIVYPESSEISVSPPA